MVRNLKFAVILVLMAVGVSFAQAPAAAPAGAPAWQGKSKMSGKVSDEAQKPVADVTVKLAFSSGGGPADIKTNAKGEWSVQNIADGLWTLEFWKDGLDPRRVPVQVGGKIKEPSIDLRMTKEGTDPTFAMQLGAAKAQAAFEKKNYAESRAVYEGLLAKYPTVYQLRQYIARDFHMDKNFDKAVEQLRLYMNEVPGDNGVKLMLASELSEVGKADEAWEMYKSFDKTVLRDALDLETPGFTLLRAKKPADALKYFERVVELYPDDPQAYYYRGLTYWQIGATVEKPNTPESKGKLESAKADLTKFMGMVPAAEKNAQDPNFNNYANAKSMLDQIK